MNAVSQTHNENRPTCTRNNNICSRYNFSKLNHLKAFQAEVKNNKKTVTKYRFIIQGGPKRKPLPNSE